MCQGSQVTSQAQTLVLLGYAATATPGVGGAVADGESSGSAGRSPEIGGYTTWSGSQGNGPDGETPHPLECCETEK